jgi:hypothetical protein
MDADGQDDEPRAKLSQTLKINRGKNMKGRISSVIRRLRVRKRVAVAAVLFGLVGRVGACSAVPCGAALVTAGGILLLALIPGSPFAAEGTPLSVACDPIGRFAYVANPVDNDVLEYMINGSGGALIPLPGKPFAGAVDPHSVAVDPSGRFAYVGDLKSNTVSGFTINATSGALTPIAGSPFGAGSGSFSVAVSGQIH